MPLRAAAAVFIVLALAVAQPAGAQQTPGFSLQLYANLPALEPTVPGDPFSVRRGTEIHYRIEATVPSSVPDVEYYFEMPPGTLFVAADAREGARIRTEIGHRGDEVVFVEPRAPSSRVEITVRVNDVYQGSVNAIARFRGQGPGDVGARSSNIVTFQFDHGDGVPGSLHADAFVDMEGNGGFNGSDVRQSCAVYVYDDLAGFAVPDDISDPTDARLPLASVARTTFDEPASVNLFPGKYSVLFGACDTPLPPSGLPITTFELIDRPPVSLVRNQSGTTSYEVQHLEVASTQVSVAIRGARPIGPTATPTDLRFDGAVLRWTDRAEGESGYMVEVSGTASGRFEMAADSTDWTAPDGINNCGPNQLSITLTALIDGVGGFPARIGWGVARDCIAVTAPQTGTGRAVHGGPPVMPLMTLLLGSAFAAAGGILAGRRLRAI